MSVVEKVGARTRIEQRPEGLRITVRPQRDWGQFLFLTAWLCGWAAGEVFAAASLARGIIKGFERGGLGENGASVAEMLFMLVFLAFWTLFGVVALSSWVYMLVGAEVIEVDALGLTTWYKHPLLRKRRRYEAARIRNLRARRGPTRAVARVPGPLRASPGAGSIVFEYQRATARQEEQAEEEAAEEDRPQGRTVFIAAGVDVAEARQIADTILQRFPSLGPQRREGGEEASEKW